MSTFTDVVKNDTPRLVVEYRCTTPGNEAYRWGIVKNEAMQPLGLIGYIAQVQSALINGDADCREDTRSPSHPGKNPSSGPQYCDQSALVIASVDGEFCYFIHPSIPLSGILGILECIKAVLVGARLAHSAGANQPPILGPDGRPMMR